MRPRATLLAGVLAALLAGTGGVVPRMRARREPKECPVPWEEPEPAPAQLQVRVVTLNAWGLLGVSRRRHERMGALAAWLRRCERCLTSL